MVKVFTAYICTIVILAIAWVIGGTQYLDAYGSPVPRAESGLVVPIEVNHGRTVYVSQRFDKMIHVGNGIAIGMAGVSLLVLMLRPIKRKTTLPPITPRR
jgi:hypothetical protein